MHRKWRPEGGSRNGGDGRTNISKLVVMGGNLTRKDCESSPGKGGETERQKESGCRIGRGRGKLQYRESEFQRI
ncbi:hypothetical protein L6452_15854 [Arctium lappa]|uniref:Uncharacterized protein n=1 Tax=Arctium lappa TaxID=4217 RepID=A0ACB9CPY2_ARCLA|nr:hypothetical protein L6452_15854 [Arctium lappa]